MTEPRTTLILTYNDVLNYPAGVYESGDNTVYLHSQDTRYYERSPEKLAQLLHNMDYRVDLEKVDEVFVYSGLNAAQESLDVAHKISQNKKTTLVACKCDRQEKEEFSRLFDVELIYSECGGRATLEKIMDNLLK